MKKLLIAIIILLAATVYGADQTITFQWQPNPDEVAGYNIYAGESASGPWVKINPELISETTYTYTYSEALEAQRWFYCTASDGRNESEPSNVVDCAVDTIPPGKPGTFTLSSD